MDQKHFLDYIACLVKDKKTLIEEVVERYDKNQFFIIVATVISARAKDKIVLTIIDELFLLIKNPQHVIKVPVEAIAIVLRPVGMAFKKASYIKRTAEYIVENGYPATIESLCQLPGVGRKCATLIASTVYNIPAICVDTHVLRLSFLWGFSEKKTLLLVERDLMRVFDIRYWISINRLFVLFGQYHCCSLKKGNHEKCCNKANCLVASNLALKIICYDRGKIS